MYRKLERFGFLTERLTTATPGGSLGHVWRHRLIINGEIKVVISRDGDGDKAHYLHRDHLGSLTAITDALGNIIAEHSYAEWGEATRIDNWNQTNAASSNTAFLKITDEAYTGQETLAFGLLHYNGRVYDSVVGQFLSADPLIASPFDLQNANRRSYVGNSPLSSTDPTGYIRQVMVCTWDQAGQSYNCTWVDDPSVAYGQMYYGGTSESSYGQGIDIGGGGGSSRAATRNGWFDDDDETEADKEELIEMILEAAEINNVKGDLIGKILTAADIVELTASSIQTTLLIGVLDIKYYQNTAGGHVVAPIGSTKDWRKVDWSKYGADSGISAEQVMANFINSALGTGE